MKKIPTIEEIAFHGEIFRHSLRMYDLAVIEDYDTIGYCMCKYWIERLTLEKMMTDFALALMDAEIKKIQLQDITKWNRKRMKSHPSNSRVYG